MVPFQELKLTRVSSSRADAWIQKCCVAAGSLALGSILTAGGTSQAAGAGDPPASQQRRSYYKYTDDNGVLHITNTPQPDRAWKHWKDAQPRTGQVRANAHRVKARRRAKAASRRYDFDEHIAAAAKRYFLPQALVRAVIHTESRFRPLAVSSAGARGLMQLMPKTADSLGVRDSFDPRQNIMGGCKLLRLLANRYDGDLVLVMAAYHAGAGAVKRYGGVPPYESTRKYVVAVIRRYHEFLRTSSPSPQK